MAYRTLSGFVMHRLGHVPKESDIFEFDGFQFEIIDMDRHRIDKVLIRPVIPAITPGP